jgi:tetratricopeptide (TPR) repeat protein
MTRLLSSMFILGFLSLTACGGGSAAEQAATEKRQQAQSEADKELQDLIARSLQIKLLSEQIDKDPDNAQLRYTRGTLLSQANAPTQAAFDLDRALQLDSTQTNYYLAAADLYFSMENAVKAARILESAPKEDPAISTQLGKYYFYLKQYDKAEAALKTALALHPKNDQARFWLGCTYRDQQKNDEAIAQLAQAIALNPELYNAQMMLAQLYANQRNDKALQHYEIAARLDTINAEADYGKAVYLQNTNRTQEALAAYRAILKKDSQYTNAYYQMGTIYVAQKNYTQALQNFNIAVRTSPAFADAYYMRGWCAEQLGKREDALQDYEKTLTFEPQHAKAAEALQRLSKP